MCLGLILDNCNITPQGAYNPSKETEVNDVKDGKQHTRLGIHIKFKVVEGEVAF